MNLTRYEQQVYELVVEGLSNKEIAVRLRVSIPTVKGRMGQILLKSGVRTRLRLVVAHYKTTAT